MSRWPARTLAERMEAHIEPEPNSGCWLWVGAAQVWGYGVVQANGLQRAHRVMYELSRGPIPEGLDLDHLCRVRSCVNPAHLEPVTRRTNLLRGRGFVAENARKTHCPRGHQHSPENQYPSERGIARRRCRVCCNARSLARYYRHHAESA